MTPPGLTFISVSDKAWKRAESAKCPRYYWDIFKARKSMEKDPPQNPYTPAISLLRALNKALELIMEEGLQNVFLRHSRLAEGTRRAIEAMGLSLFAKENSRSDCITSVTVPEGIDGNKVKSLMEDKYGVIIAGGQESLKGKILRIGHMGYVDENDILTTINALERALYDVGYKFELGSGTKEAMEFFSK